MWDTDLQKKLKVSIKIKEKTTKPKPKQKHQNQQTKEQWNICFFRGVPKVALSAYNLS